MLTLDDLMRELARLNRDLRDDATALNEMPSRDYSDKESYDEGTAGRLPPSNGGHEN
jgi:hypothetical protein